MKRIFALLFAALLLTAQVCAAAPAQPEVPEEAEAVVEAVEEAVAEAEAEAAAAPEVPEEAVQIPVAADHLTVGNPNPFRGEFFTDLWGNITSDQDVRNLIHGYNLVQWYGAEGVFSYDPMVVTHLSAVENEAGDHVYTFTLAKDLCYSDGTPITARDYAFSLLLQIAPEMKALGATPAQKPQIVGYQAYAEGKVPYLAGVRVLGDNTIAITLDHAYLPFFYEMGLLDCTPYPISVIAPGVAVRDDGAGVYLANEDPEVKEPVFTAELLKGTILNGYQSHPEVVSGPYTLVSFEGDTAEFEINPYYKGNKDGVRPTIQHITYKTADNATMADALKNGAFNVLNKVMNKDAITGSLAMITAKENEGAFLSASYPRTGLSFVSFACEKPALADAVVRRAIAFCMDRDQIAQDYTGNYGAKVDGYYGEGQWMYNVVTGAIWPKDADPAAYAELNLDNLMSYGVDVAAARALLEGAGWVLNEETGIREKEIDGRPVALDLTLVYPEGSAIADSFAQNFVPNLEEAGIRLTLVPENMTDLLNEYYDPQNRKADMIFVASNFEELYDPSGYFTEAIDRTTGQKVHTWTTTGCADEGLYNTAVAMRTTKPGDVLNYTRHWIEFQERFNEVLPVLPVYSNVYFDFYTSALHGYEIGQNTNMAEALIPASIIVEPAEG